MAPEADDEIRNEAISWHIRLRDGDDVDFEGFTAWLEVSPKHAPAYDAVALADAELKPLLAQARWPVPAANDDDPPVRWFAGRRALLGVLGAVAAVLIGVAVGLRLLDDGRYAVATGPGQQRVVAVGEGSRIALNGDSRVVLDRDDPRFASLERGEALFTIRHDKNRPFTLEAGGDRIVDAGTVFNVVRDGAGTVVEVAEGAVVYNPQRQAIMLQAGQTLFDRAGPGEVDVAAKAPAAIGGWSAGRLDYLGSPLSVIAADLTRTMGTRVTIAPAISAQRFTGTIQIDRNEARMFARLAGLLDADVRATDDGWMISARKRAAR